MKKKKKYFDGVQSKKFRYIDFMGYAQPRLSYTYVIKIFWAQGLLSSLFFPFQSFLLSTEAWKQFVKTFKNFTIIKRMWRNMMLMLCQRRLCAVANLFKKAKKKIYIWLKFFISNINNDKIKK